MTATEAEWWSGRKTAAAEMTARERLGLTIESMMVNLGRAIWRLVDPPYPTPDGKPLDVYFYQLGESPFTPQQMERLSAIAKMFQERK